MKFGVVRQGAGVVDEEFIGMWSKGLSQHEANGDRGVMQRLVHIRGAVAQSGPRPQSHFRAAEGAGSFRAAGATAHRRAICFWTVGSA